MSRVISKIKFVEDEPADNADTIEAALVDDNGDVQLPLTELPIATAEYNGISHPTTGFNIDASGAVSIKLCQGLSFDSSEKVAVNAHAFAHDSLTVPTVATDGTVSAADFNKLATVVSTLISGLEDEHIISIATA